MVYYTFQNAITTNGSLTIAPNTTLTIHGNASGALNVNGLGASAGVINNSGTITLNNNRDVTIFNTGTIQQDDVVTRLAWNVFFHHCFMPRPRMLGIKSDKNETVEYTIEKSILGIVVGANKQTFYFDAFVRSKILSYLQPSFLRKKPAPPRV